MKLAGLFLTVIAALASASTPSLSDTIVLAGSSGTITDATGTVWGINATAPCMAAWAPAGALSMLTKNGASDLTTCQVTELAYVNGVIWQQNTAGNWYSWNGTAWSGPTTASPVPPSSAVLVWVAPTTDTNGAKITVPLVYNVYRGASATALVKLTQVTGLTYTDPAGSTAPTTYYYAVTAVQAGQESAMSQVVSATIEAPTLIPSPPTAVVVTAK